MSDIAESVPVINTGTINIHHSCQSSRLLAQSPPTPSIATSTSLYSLRYLLRICRRSLFTANSHSIANTVMRCP